MKRVGASHRPDFRGSPYSFVSSPCGAGRSSENGVRFAFSFAFPPSPPSWIISEAAAQIAAAGDVGGEDTAGGGGGGCRILRNQVPG